MEDLMRYVWVVPAIPFVSFWILLLGGKRLHEKFGDKGVSAVGITSVGLCFVLALGIGSAWIDRAESALEGETIPAEIVNVDLADPSATTPTVECYPAVDSHGGGHGDEGDHAEEDGDHSEEDGDHADEDSHDEDESHGEDDHGDDSHGEDGKAECGDVLGIHVEGAHHDDHDDDHGTADDHGDEVESHEGDEEHARGPPLVVPAGDTLLNIAAPAAVAAGDDGHGGGSAGPVVARTTWFTWGGTDFTVGTHLDGLAAMMLFVVTLISLLVHVYSTEYVKGDRRFTHYYAFLSLFTASMLFYVVSENILQMLVGWELVGVCSFGLIGHWWEEKPNSDAALKAFLTNRVGDMGLLIGVIVLFFATGGSTFSVLGINDLVVSDGVSHTMLLAASLLLFAGVTSKSGQFPLHTWLPDAMAGPTPVSALIHAATMVVAGVYLIARLYPVFYEGLSIDTGTINYVAFIGGFTTVMGGALAFVQKDIKKVLAYSTVSQLGYMVMALGVGAWTAAIFHVFTHAFFKAALFLGAGSLSHACHHSFNMVDDMGGLRKIMPHTFRTFVISSMALAGIFPLAGFWSKDEILAGAAGGQSGGGYTLMLVMGCITAFLTAAYMGRAIWYAFFGEYRGHHHPHESPPTITVPLYILTFLAVTVGFLNYPSGTWLEFIPAHKFQDWVEPTAAFPGVVHNAFNPTLAIVSTVLAVSGMVIGILWFEKGWGKNLSQNNALLGAGRKFLENKYYLDDLYEKVIRDGVKGPIAAGVNWFNKNVLDGIINGAGRLSVGFGKIVYKYFDQAVIDGAVNATGVASEASGEGLRKVQTGRIKDYGALLFGGALAIAGGFVLVISNS